eukprot:Plantae.Rhodophyta-Purpureofilum_apyrenoidigerum.ctg7443.p1 GENE.Plantae.Rhodophyta-Purpureofilum_apyrenoidigerum.ctg7443~~Plantae.Rhodophyta-Purpureofilum_apyrenoidigerum.ctg7443.p1  ORF type:complete len:634 (+),score=136.55 Plantae.Rhodophyta-Purpureofilum_apyrenoidigerum.ctg7443:121-2022(+)
MSTKESEIGTATPTVEPENVDVEELLPKRGESTLRSLLSGWYIVLLVLRFVCVYAPGLIDHAEYQDGQSAVFNMFFGAVSDGSSGRVAEMELEYPTKSIVVPLITSMVPYTLAKQMQGADAILLFILPRVWMFILSIALDVLSLQALNIISGEGRKNVLFLLATSWTTVVITVRPVNAVVECICVAGILYGLLGVTSDYLRIPVFMLFYAVGMFCRPTFIAYGVVLIYYVVTVLMKPNVKVVPIIVGILVGAVVFLAVFVEFAVLDSLFYNTLTATIGSKTYTTLSDIVQDFVAGTLDIANLLNVKFKGALTIVPFNVFAHFKYSEFRSQLQNLISPGQLLFYYPLVAGPLAIVLGVDSWDSLQKLYKDVLGEIKASTSTKRKKKTKRLPTAAKIREEDNTMFADIAEMTLTVGLSVEVVLGGRKSGILTVLPALLPSVLMFHDKILGPKAYKNASKYWVVYNFLAAIFFGFVHDSGIMRLTLGLTQGEKIVGDAGPTTVFIYNAATPASYILGDNAYDIRLLDLNVTRDEFVYTKMRARIDHEDDPSRSYFLAAPGTSPLTEDEGFTKLWHFNGHLSLHHMPKNIDALFKRSTLDIYKPIDRFIIPAEKPPEDTFSDFTSSSGSENSDRDDL